MPSDQDATGRTLGDEEIALLAAAIRQRHAHQHQGRSSSSSSKTRFAAAASAPSTPTPARTARAAIHCAVAAIDPEPGDEIVTTSITDMGALTPILYQGAIPVFADVDPATCNVTAETIERAPQRAHARPIIVTHLFGNPCDMTEIMELCRAARHRR